VRVLVVEDERSMASYLRKGLRENAYAVDLAFDGEDGLHLATHESYDIIILDIMLPKIDGIQVLRIMREAGVTTPVILLTARDTVQDRVRGLDTGADDYLIKPFSFSELMARMRACLRRRFGEQAGPLKVADLTLDPLTRRVARAGKTIDLTQTEYALLEFMLRNKGCVLTRTTISEHVWDANFESFSNVVDVHVHHLRDKVDKPFKTPLIHTVRGAGYVLEARDH